MFGHRISVDRELFERIRQSAARAGYASPEEFVIHVLEREVDRVLGGGDHESDEEVKRRLRGLGYIE